MASLKEKASSASLAVLASQRTVFLDAFPINLADIFTASPTAAYSCREATPACSTWRSKGEGGGGGKGRGFCGCTGCARGCYSAIKRSRPQIDQTLKS